MAPINSEEWFRSELRKALAVFLETGSRESQGKFANLYLEAERAGFGNAPGISRYNDLFGRRIGKLQGDEMRRIRKKRRKIVGPATAGYRRA
ncbi:MAG: hypothetical protein ABID38_07380 [Candidatus Diapherotrites archaeon]